MKKIIFSVALAFITLSISAQEYQFKDIIDLEATPVVSQGSTGTCWSFSTSSFLESEIMRKTGKKIELSQMYNVRHTYPAKAENYVMRNGKAQFSEGGLAHDVINSMRDYGIVPFSVYTGLNDKKIHNHAEMFKALDAIVKAYTTAKAPISSQWRNITDYILDSYLGQNPTNFTFEGKSYTPMSFLKMTTLNADDYITITSFSDQKLYTPFIINIPDNFSNGSLYNLPLSEYIANIDNALEQGYTLSLDCDVSETTFSSKHGIAFVSFDKEDQEKGLTQIIEETPITNELRLQEFYNGNTQDDHLMHIVGKVSDQNGNIYYKVKNSWGADSDRVGNQGYIYMSVAFVQLKSISVLLHKDGLLKATKNKLAIK